MNEVFEKARALGQAIVESEEFKTMRALEDEAMAMLSAITGCRVQAYGIDTLTYRASLGNAAAAKLAAGALAMNDRLSGRGDAVEAGRRL